MSKYLQFAILLVLCVGLDQGTKRVASERLATTHSWIDHPMVLVVSDGEGETVEDVLRSELRFNDADEIGELARRYVTNKDGTHLQADSKVSPGDELRVRYRKVAVIPDYFEFEYTRNQGAAFGLLSDGDSPMRVPFFILVSLVAIGVIIMMLRGVDRRDYLSIVALAFIAGGALGNFIDRVSYGWVIDFIVWKATDAYRWPTFNIADAFISVGVSLLILQMAVDSVRARRAASMAAPVTED